MPYGVKVLLDGTDITDKVSKLEIASKLDAYCRELSLDIADPDLYDTIDFSIMPIEPVLEVQTRVDTAWVSQGLFFVEKPTYQVGIHATQTGLWGRSKTALLGPPFAVKITKTWDTDTTFFAIAAELLEAAGLTWDPSYSDVNDFIVHGRTYQAELKHPVEILKELLQLAHGDDAFVTTDAAGHVCIKRIDRAPAIADHTITDPVAVSISEEPEWPDFGNRIRISSAGSLSGYSVRLVAPSSCLSADTETRGKLFARVTDSDGVAVNDVPVNWSSSQDLVVFDEPTTNTQTVVFPDEQVRAKNFYEIEVQFPPSFVISVFAYRDFMKTDDLALDGYTLEGNTIRLTHKLSYCDQMLVVSYMSAGIAVNWMSAGATPGTDKISAEVAGNVATQDVYLDNPCNCPASLALRADPSSITIKASSGLLAYVEIGGSPVRDGRSIWMTLDSTPTHGHIDWTEAYLGKVEITNEETQAQNVISGVTQCEISMFPDSVTGVWRTRENAEGDLVKDGDDLYGSHVQKVINLLEEVTTGERLIVDYVAVGAASNIYDGISPGTDIVRAMIMTTREEPTEARVSISVSKEDGSGDDPDGCCNDGLCEQEATSCDSAPADCDSGKVWCARSGVYGCYAASECDTCAEGKVTCTKGREPGCYPSNECDTDHVEGGIGKVYARKDGTDGCYMPEELDSCGVDKVICYKDGSLSCWPVEECDTAYGGSTEECAAGKQCCTHRSTLKKGCFASVECKPGSGSKGGSGGKKEHDSSKGTKCKKNDGSVVTCGEGKACCEKGGKRDCYASNECDGGGAGCNTTPCQDSADSNCLSGRFGGTVKGCTCDELCQAEFDKYGTIQSYDGGSYRTFEQIVEEDYGLSPDTKEYWEKYGDIRQEAFDECRKQCGECKDVGELSLTGSDAVTKPGAYQCSVSGGLSPYTWEVSGQGTTISEDGLLSLDSSACGAFTVTVTDGCGKTASLTGRVTNAGRWHLNVYVTCMVPGVTVENQCGEKTIISGDTMILLMACETRLAGAPYHCEEYYASTSHPCSWNPSGVFCAFRWVEEYKWVCS